MYKFKDNVKNVNFSRIVYENGFPKIIRIKIKNSDMDRFYVKYNSRIKNVRVERLLTRQQIGGMLYKHKPVLPYFDSEMINKKRSIRECFDCYIDNQDRNKLKIGGRYAFYSDEPARIGETINNQTLSDYKEWFPTQLINEKYFNLDVRDFLYFSLTPIQFEQFMKDAATMSAKTEVQVELLETELMEW